MKKLFHFLILLAGINSVAQASFELIPIDYYTLSINNSETLAKAKQSKQPQILLRSILYDSAGQPVKAIMLEKDEMAAMQTATVLKVDVSLPQVNEILLLRSTVQLNARFEIDRYLFMLEDSIVELPFLRNEYYDGINYVHELRFRESKNNKTLIDIVRKSRQLGMAADFEPLETYAWDGTNLKKI